MRKSSENQRNNGILSEYFSPGSKVRDFYIPHHNPTFSQETPMKQSQIPNRFPHQPYRRSLPFHSPEQHHRHRPEPHPHFGMSPCHPPHPPHHPEWHHYHGYSPASQTDGENYTYKQPQQHHVRAQATQGPVHHWCPMTPSPHPCPPVNHVNHTSKDVMLPERDPQEKSIHTVSRREPEHKAQGKDESGPLEAVAMMEQDKPSGRALLSGSQKNSVLRQRCDSWTSSSSGLALCPVTDQGRRASFPLQHTHTKNHEHEIAASHSSNTRDTPQKRHREFGSEGDNVKKPCLHSVQPDKTVKSPSSVALSPHRQLSGLDHSPNTLENHPRVESLHANIVKPVHSHGPKLGVKQACFKSSNNNMLILTSPLRKNEILTKTHEESKKKDISSTPPSQRSSVSSNNHGLSNDPKNLHKVPPVGDNKTDLNCNKPQVGKPSRGSSSARKLHRPKKPPLPDDLNDLFTPDPVYIVNSGQKTLKVWPDDKVKIVNNKTCLSSISSQAQIPVSKACQKEKMSTLSISSAKVSSANVVYPDGIRISLPTVNVTRLVLPSFMEKDVATSRRPSTSPSRTVRQSEEREKKSTRDDSLNLDLDLELDLDMDLDAQSICSSDSEDEPLVSLQEIMRSKKLPDTPEKGAFSDPSTPGHDNHKRQPYTLSTTKMASYKNNLDQMLKEITTSKKVKEVETELLTACQEDLLRIAEFEEAELNEEEPLSTEHQQILQRYSLLSSAIREVPPGHEVFNLEKFGCIFNQNTLQLRQCTLNPRETAQKTLLWSSHAQFKLYVNIGLFQEAYECSPCPFQITRFLFKMMCVHSDSILSVKILQVLTDIAYIAATQILSGSRAFRVWVPSVADITLVIMNMGVPFVSLFPLETLQPPFTEGDLLENVYIKSESPSNQTPSTFPQHNCNNMFKYLDCCLGLCPRAYSDGELVLLLTALCTVSLETHLILQASVEFEPLLYKLLNNIRCWEDMMPKICVALTNLTDDHHNMCYLVQLLPEHARGKNLRRHLSLSMISKLLDGSCVYRAKPKELQLCDLRLYVWRMKPSSLLHNTHSHTEGGKDTELRDQQAYYLCYSLLTLTNEATNVQFFPAHQKEHLLFLCSELERHVKCHIRESEKCLYRSKVKDLVARIYTKWQMLLQKTRPLNGKLYDYWQPLQGDSGGNQDIEEIESSQEVTEKDGVSDEEEDTVEMIEDGAKREDDEAVVIEGVVTQNEEAESTLEKTSFTIAASEAVDEDLMEETRQAEGMGEGELDQFVGKHDEDRSVVEEKANCTFEMETGGGEACTQEDGLCEEMDTNTEDSSVGPPSPESQCGDMQTHTGATALLSLVQTS